MAKGRDLAPFPTGPVPSVPRDVHGPRGRSPSPSPEHLPIEAGPCPPAHLPAAELIHYPRNTISTDSSSGKLSLIKRVKPRGRGLAGSPLQRAGGPGRGSTSLAPRGRAMERGSRALGHAGNATRWQGRAMHGWHPCSGAARKPSYNPARAVQHPSKATGRSGPGPAAGPGCPGAVPAPSRQPSRAVPQFPLRTAGSLPPPKARQKGAGGEVCADGRAWAGRLPSSLHFWVKPRRSSLRRHE